MPKRRRTVSAHWLYRRNGIETIYARDRQGRYNCYRMTGPAGPAGPAGRAGRVVRPLPGGITSLGPVYNRVNFANRVRFNGRVRDQMTLKNAFDHTPIAQRLTTGVVLLPQTRSTARRTARQGMDGAMTTLTGAPRSAREYTDWCRGRHPHVGLRPNLQWEWCHLLAHSLGGQDSPQNVVAAVRGNNSEQLAIETALQMYRNENMFRMQISAACMGANDGRHIGNVIEYRVSCIYSNNPTQDFVQYLDCLNAPNPSEIHYYDLLESVALWANRKLVQVSEQIFGNPVRSWEADEVQQYIEMHI